MSLQHILLGLLSESPNSGYELNKRLETVGQHIWLTEQSQIYRALYKMTSNGWVSFELVAQEATPNKKVYSLTSVGREEFEQWSHTAPDTDPNAQSWLAQLFLTPNLTEIEARILIQQRIMSVQGKLIWARDRHHQENHSAPHKSFTLRYYMNILEAETEWLETSLAQLHETFPPD